MPFFAPATALAALGGGGGATAGGLGLSAALGPIGLGVAGLGALGSLFGRKKQRMPQGPTFQSFRTPLGSLTQEMGTIKYRPNLTNTQKKTQSLTDSQIFKTLQGLPSSFTVNDFYNNPFYDSSFSLMSRPIEQQRLTEQRDLDNMLNARNQLGSSFNALQQDLMNRRYDALLGEARDKAREVSAQAWQQQYQNALTKLGALRADRSEATQMAYIPMNSGLNAMQVLASNGLAGQQLAQQAALQRQNMSNNNFSTLLSLLPMLTKVGLS